MTERVYRCGDPYDADHPDPSRCHQHGAGLEPRVLWEGWALHHPRWTGKPVFASTREGLARMREINGIQQDMDVDEVKVRLVEVVEP